MCGSGEAFSLFGAIRAADFGVVSFIPQALTACAEGKAPAQDQAVERARARLAAPGECTLLVNPSQLGMLSSVTAMISHAVDYAPGMGSKSQHDALPQLPAFGGIWHILQTKSPPADLNSMTSTSQNVLSHHAAAVQGKENLGHASGIGISNCRSPLQMGSNAGEEREKHSAAVDSTVVQPRQQLKRKVLQPSLEYMLGDAKHSSGRRAQAMHQMRTRQAAEDAAAAKRASPARVTPLKRKPTPKKGVGAPAEKQAHAIPARQQTLPAMTKRLQRSASPLRLTSPLHAHGQMHSNAGNALDLNHDGEWPASARLDWRRTAQIRQMAGADLDLTSKDVDMGDEPSAFAFQHQHSHLLLNSRHEPQRYEHLSGSSRLRRDQNGSSRWFLQEEKSPHCTPDIGSYPRHQVICKPQRPDSPPAKHRSASDLLRGRDIHGPLMADLDKGSAAYRRGCAVSTNGQPFATEQEHYGACGRQRPGNDSHLPPDGWYSPGQDSCRRARLDMQDRVMCDPAERKKDYTCCRGDQLIPQQQQKPRDDGWQNTENHPLSIPVNTQQPPGRAEVAHAALHGPILEPSSPPEGLPHHYLQQAGPPMSGFAWISLQESFRLQTALWQSDMSLPSMIA